MKTITEREIGLQEKPRLRRKPNSPRLHLDITKELIQAAVPRDSNHCMIAEAVKIAFPGARGVAVDLATIRFSDRKKRLRYSYMTPRIAQATLVNFDQGRKPEPFSFLLRGAMVTRAVSSSTGHKKTARRSPTKAQSEATRKATLVRRNEGLVPERVGGKTPPLQKSSDNVPFSRRRAFGLRALEL
jgi:hypothetical protein